jgi:hypothetical protein
MSRVPACFYTDELKATGITNPTSGIIYKWITVGFSADTTEGQNIIITTPSTTGDYTVTVSASADGFYSKSNSLAVKVIDITSENSLKGLKKSGEYITDPRDGKVYYYSTIGDLDWFNYNLNYESAGKAYKDETLLPYLWVDFTHGLRQPQHE